ncbi:MAG: PQQ-binding-like beta-propeller repeat protein [Pseudotabrizicola sp.]|uniref:PQQ-like beta-propeller repeat protein n=1 Tax=Pseudotabrizicola sp. TaxID=2939647 RepID=UPI002720F7DF|nr:PQQ-like beta-propeller repeat protein [Pseudotabrizicola sp.]MDO9637470.1 PQQ-binding-like beta-propeller repeat protein [Pseudotabrizicola sp.]
MKQKCWLGLSAMTAVLLLSACERELILPGERFPVRADLDASVRLEGQPAPVAPSALPPNRSVPISLPAAAANADWSHRGGSARHASPHGRLSATPARVWSANIGAGSSRKNRISTSPVVADGRIVTMDSNALVVATGTNGATLWQADLTAPFDRGGAVSGGGVALGGGMVFVATGYGELVALQASSGAVVWRQRLASPVSGAPAYDGGTVYVATRDGAGWAVDARNGKVQWTVPGLPNTLAVSGSSAPAVTDRTVIFPFPSGELVSALRLNGVRVWGAPVTGQRPGRGYQGLTDLTGDPVIVGSTIYAGTAAGRTAAINAGSGDRIWTAVEGAMNPPLVVGGSVFVVNDEARLVRLDAATGEVIWLADMPYFENEKPRRHKAITAHYGPVLAGGRVIVVSGDGILRQFSATDGTLVGTAQIPGGAAAAPALAGGALYVVSTSGQLHAFR